MKPITRQQCQLSYCYVAVNMSCPSLCVALWPYGPSWTKLDTLGPSYGDVRLRLQLILEVLRVLIIESNNLWYVPFHSNILIMCIIY